MAFDFTKDLEIGGVETNVNIGQFPVCPPMLEFVRLRRWRIPLNMNLLENT